MVTTTKAPKKASPEAKAAAADRFIASKSAHALLAIIGSGQALPYALTPADLGSADARRTARKLASHAPTA